jgi:hypothetical protein
MPFYDAYTTETSKLLMGSRFLSFPTSMPPPTAGDKSAPSYQGLIGAFTESDSGLCTLPSPNAQFEVLYPPMSTIRRSISYQLPRMTGLRRNLACLKTENFTYTAERNLDLVRQSIQLPSNSVFPRPKAVTWWAFPTTQLHG